MEKREGRVRAERSDKKIHVNSCYKKSIHDKLVKFALGCGTTKTQMQAYFVELCLNNENILNFVQDQFKESAHFRIIPSRVDGELNLLYAEKKQSYKK